MSTTVLGQTVSHYRVLQPLGEGGMGVVYRGEDVKLGRPVALKFISADRAQDRQVLERFLREARTASALNHPNICTIYEIDEFEGAPFIAMELLEGQTLDRKIDGRPLRISQVIDYAVQICDALEAAHARGILHRDVKPANIFVTTGDRLKVLDFGLAKSSASRSAVQGTLLSDAETEVLSTRAGVALGTIAYMSPEQARGEDLDARSDLFSLGIVLYEMTTGQRTFQGSTSAVVFDAILNREPPAPIELNANVPPALERIIARALDKDRTRRFQTAADLRAALQHVAVERTASGASRVPRSAAESRSGASWPSAAHGGSQARSNLTTRTGLAVAGGLAVVAALAAIWMYARPTTPAPESAQQASAPEAVAPSTVAPLIEPAPVDAPAAQVPPPPGTPVTPSATQAVAGRRGSAPPSTPPAQDVPPAAVVRVPDPLAEQVKVARAKADAKLYDQAIADVRAGLAATPAVPSAPMAYLVLASFFERAARPDDAMAAYVELRSRYGKSPEAAEGTFLLASLILQSKRSDRDDEARRLYSEITLMNAAGARAPQALLRRAAIEDRTKARVADPTLGAVPASLLTFRHLVDSYPTSPGVEAALARLGEMYEDMRRYELAGQALLDLARKFPETKTDAAWKAGELFEKRVKDPQRARDAYALVPPRSPRYRDAQKKLQS